MNLNLIENSIDKKLGYLWDQCPSRKLRIFACMKFFAIFQGRDKILLNCRYRDDGFMLYNGSEEDIYELFITANNTHDLYEISENNLIILS